MRDFLRGFLVALLPGAALSGAVLAGPDGGAPQSVEEAAVAQAAAEAPAPIEAPPERVPGLCVAARCEAEPRDEAEAPDLEEIERRYVPYVPLSVRVVDGLDGALVAGAKWALEKREEGFDTEAIRHVARSAEWSGIRALPRSGYVVWDSVPPTPSSRYARSAVAFLPLRREVPYEVEFVSPAGRRVEGCHVLSAWVAGRTLPVPPSDLASGRSRIHGMPFLPGASLSLSLDLGGNRLVDSEFDSWFGVVPDSADTFVASLRVVPKAADAECDPFEPAQCNRLIGIGCHGCCAPRSERPAPEGRLDLVVRRSDGRPASSAEVIVYRLVGDGRRWTCRPRLDEGGRLTLRLPAARYAVLLDENGLLPVEREVRIAADETTHAEMRERDGGTLVVDVRDSRDRRLAFAHLDRVKPCALVPWVDLDPASDVQRIDGFVDEHGERVLRRLPAGPLEIRASWGSWTGEIKVTMREGATETATIVVK